MTPGLYENLSFQEYAALMAANYSTLKHFCKSPAHAKTYLTEPSEMTEDRLIGLGVHLKMLEPERFEKEVVQIDGNRNSTAVKDAIKIAEADGKMVLKSDVYTTICRMADAGTEKAKRMGLFANGFYESTIVAVDPGTGCLMKARPDYLDPERGLIVDVKTYSDASEPGFRKQMWKLRYDLQSAHYLRCASVHFGPVMTDFVSLVIETKGHHGVNLIRTDDATLERATGQLYELLARFKECMETDIWPSYPDSILSSNVDIY